jgi:hypothetical protein
MDLGAYFLFFIQVITVFVIVGVIFVPIGVVSLRASHQVCPVSCKALFETEFGHFVYAVFFSLLQVVEIVDRYDDACVPANVTDKLSYIQNSSIPKTCTRTLTVMYHLHVFFRNMNLGMANNIRKSICVKKKLQQHWLVMQCLIYFMFASKNSPWLKYFISHLSAGYKGYETADFCVLSAG